MIARLLKFCHSMDYLLKVNLLEEVYNRQHQSHPHNDPSKHPRVDFARHPAAQQTAQH